MVTNSSPALTNIAAVFIQYPLFEPSFSNEKTDRMPIEELSHEMEGKIAIFDNRIFIGLVGLVGAYYVAFLSFLTYVIVHKN